MLSENKYIMIDLIMLAVLGVGIEIVASVVSHNALSLQLIVVLIAIYRWNWKGLLVNVPIAMTTYICAAITNEIDWKDISVLVVYLFGALGLLLALFMKKVKKINKKGFVFVFFYCIIGYVGQAFVRAFIALMFGNGFREVIVYYLGYGHLVGFAVTYVVLMILVKQGGVLVEPIQYIIEQREEVKRLNEENKLGFQFKNLDEKDISSSETEKREGSGR